MSLREFISFAFLCSCLPIVDDILTDNLIMCRYLPCVQVVDGGVDGCLSKDDVPPFVA